MSQGHQRTGDVPVLVIAFNRPDRLATLLDRLRDVKPSVLYVAVDGPRAGVRGETDQVLATRDQVGSVDWSCDVRTLFREDNVGCGQGVSGAISWLFSEQDRGVILEDDLVPDPSFFAFCEALLDRYEHDDRVWAVSGCNFVPPGHLPEGESYRFAKVPHIWGWATWRRSWAHYRFDVRGWRRRLPAADLWRVAGRSPAGLAYWAGMFDLMARGAIDTWDVQAVLTAFAEGGLTATSNVNLIENVGFGAASTHTESRPMYLREVEPMRFPIVHPDRVASDQRSDVWTRRHVLEATPLGLAAQAARFARRAAARR
jgi:hypothetical protein